MDIILSEATSADRAYLYKALSKVDIVSLVTRSAPDHRPRTRITKYFNRSKQELLDILLEDDKYWTEELYKIAIDKEEERSRLRREKARQHTEHIRTVRQKQTQEAYPDETFLDPPSDPDVMRSYKEAWIATSNAAFEQHMISGNLMPQKPSILASTLSITFIGRGKIKDLDSLHMLRVRRDAVGDALKWLQQHNKKYYGDIIIDTDRLNALPPDNIPEAITRGFRYESNKLMAEDEYYGYKPDSYFADEANVEAATPVQDDPNADNAGSADVIPLQYLGVMDNDQSQ
ncbi:hypothetical protein FRC07_012415, partial [Ceratobasidium sp. 392]